MNTLQTDDSDDAFERVSIRGISARIGFEPRPLLTHATTTSRGGYSEALDLKLTVLCKI